MHLSKVKLGVLTFYSFRLSYLFWKTISISVAIFRTGKTT